MSVSGVEKNQQAELQIIAELGLNKLIGSQYHISDKPLGSGNYGYVYLAEDNDKKKYVIKVVGQISSDDLVRIKKTKFEERQRAQQEQTDEDAQRRNLADAYEKGNCSRLRA